MTDGASRPGAVRLRVLIADDSAAIRTSLSALIARLDGVEIVGMAINGAETLEMIRRLKPDVVTLDVRMPKMSGIAVLENLQREKLQPLVMVLTGVADDVYRRKCADLGAKYFFNKVTEFEKVIEVLGEHARELAKIDSTGSPSGPRMTAGPPPPPGQVAGSAGPVG